MQSSAPTLLPDSIHSRMPAENTFWGGWRERIRALRNIPHLLQIVWRSGPPWFPAEWRAVWWARWFP